MNISRDIINTSTKPFLAWAMVQGQRETLEVSFHISEKAAEAGMLKLKKKMPAGMLAWGWAGITDSDRRWGMVV